MFDYPKWKYWIIALVVLVSGFYALPNLYLPIPAVQITAKGNSPIDASLKGTIEGVLKGNQVPYQSVEQLADRVVVRFADVATQLKGSDALAKDATLKGKYAATLNLAPSAPKWMAKLRAKAMALGLDLQGGVHFLMELDEKTVRAALDRQTTEALYSLFISKQISYTGVIPEAGKIVASFVSTEDMQKARPLIEQSLGQSMLLESAADKTIVLQYRPETIAATFTSAVEQNTATMRNRFGALVEPVIQRQGNSRMVIELPGVQDTAYAKQLIGATASLEYRAVDMQSSVNAAELVATGNIPGDSAAFKDKFGADVILKKSVIASGGEMVSASTGLDPEGGLPVVNVSLNQAAGDRMLEFTSANRGKLMAVLYTESNPYEVIGADGKTRTEFSSTQTVISQATIEGVFGKNFLTRGLTSEEARGLELSLKNGSLAAPMSFAQERVIGPSLGMKNIKAGLIAVVASFGFVLIFFGIYYKTFGLITGVALIVNLLMVVAIMSGLGSTMTLPGLAGLALTVGMSVDANVLINERIREELRRGMSPLHAIDIGYEKASGTIWDANVTALLGGLALLAFGSGPIRGFAITLCLGIATSVYSAVSLSKGIAAMLYSGRKLTKLAI